MFLDDKLVEIGRNVNINNKEEMISAIQEMIKVCFQSLTANLTADDNMEIAKKQFKRINFQWKAAALKLEKIGNGFLAQDGFEIFIKSKPEFKGLLN